MDVDNVVQICMDNASNMQSAFDILRVRYPTLYFQGCAAHCLELLLGDLGKEPWVKRLVSCTKTIVSFIQTHHMPLAIYSRYDPTFNLSHLVETQFATKNFMVDKLVNVQPTTEKTIIGPNWLIFVNSL